MMVAAGRIMAMAVVVTAVSTNADDSHTRNRLGRRHRRLSLPSAPWSGEVSKAMSVPLTDPIDIWEDNEGYDNDNDENNEEGDDVIANIIGGELLQRGDRPYLVSLGNERKNKYTHSCAGTLIASKAVLTAARKCIEMIVWVIAAFTARHLTSSRQWIIISCPNIQQQIVSLTFTEISLCLCRL